MNRCVVAFILMPLLLAVPSTSHGQTGPVSLEGSLNGAPYAIKLPADWNGTLLVYEAGYRDVADAPGEVENRVAQIAPTNMESILLSQGYGLGGSGCRVNGYNIQEGIEDTKALVSFFRETVAKPNRTVLVGVSGGSTRAAGILETGAGLFDGAVCACGVMAGTPLFFDRALDFAVAYDAAFGWPAAWGSPGDVNDYLDFEIDVLPILLPQLSNPVNFGRFEFIRLATGLPFAGFYSGPRMLFANMLFTTEARAQMERKLGGPGAQNLDHTYRLSDSDRAYLETLGVNAAVLLDDMNARAIYAADTSARSYAQRFASFDGNIKKPLLSVHAIFDGLATVDNEAVYSTINQAAGRQDLLLQVYTDGVGHCTFTPDQLLSAIRGLESWLDTGTKPDASFFPVVQGFVPGFQPSAWPQPIK